MRVRFNADVCWEDFERSLSSIDAMAVETIRRESVRGIRPGELVLIAAASPGGEISGVPDETVGVIEGTLVLPGGATLAAIRLDDNGEIVYVDPDAVSRPR